VLIVLQFQPGVLPVLWLRCKTWHRTGGDSGVGRLEELKTGWICGFMALGAEHRLRVQRSIGVAVAMYCIV